MDRADFAGVTGLVQGDGDVGGQRGVARQTAQ